MDLGCVGCCIWFGFWFGGFVSSLCYVLLLLQLLVVVGCGLFEGLLFSGILFCCGWVGG